MLIADLIRSWRARRNGVRVHRGDHLRALVDIRTIGMVYFRAPFSSGFRCTIPKGSVLNVYHEPDANDLGFNCTLVDADLEVLLVPATDRTSDKYTGHAFAFGLGDIGRRLERMRPAMQHTGVH